MASKKGKPTLTQWWKTKKSDEDQLARDIFDTVSWIDQDQRDRREKNLRCMRLYGNVDFSGMGPYSYAKAATPNLPENRVKYNIICSAVDTLCAKISKMKPRVTMLTDGGSFDAQSRAKMLTKWLYGAFKQNHVYERHQEMFRDGLIVDTGAIKHYRQGGRIVSERALANELYTDAADSLYGQPRSLYHVKFVHKDVLSEMFPDSRGAIAMSTGSLDQSAVMSMSDEEKDYVVVIEAWHLPTTDDSNDGRHVISVEKGILLNDDYTRKYFPFTFSCWSKAMLGFYGQSLADRLTGNQVEINKMLRIIQRSFHLGSAFKVFLEYGSKVSRESVNNEIGSIVYYAGQKPEFYVPKTVHEEFFRHLEWLVRSSFEEAGVSQLSAASRLPAGLDGGSGKALREYQDLETERFVLVAQMYEMSFLETARQYIDLAKEMKEDGEDLEVKAESKRFCEKIKWSEVEVTDNEYIMQMFPTASLPKEPAGLLAYVQELIQSGLVDQWFALSLLEFPDVEGVTNLKTAALDNLMQVLEDMLYKGKPRQPEPFHNLDMGIELFQMAYNRAQADGAPDSRLELLRNWLVIAQGMKAKAATPPPMMPPGAPGQQIPQDPSMGGAIPGGPQPQISISTNGAAPQVA